MKESSANVKKDRFLGQMQEIHNKRMLIERIKANNVERLLGMKQELQDLSPESVKKSQHPTRQTLDKVQSHKKANQTATVDKNGQVSDTDKMVFDKRFKNFLNHKQEYIDKARNKAKMNALRKNGQKLNLEGLADAQYYNEEQVLSNTGSDYQYRDANDMQEAYTQMTTGKKRKGTGKQLFHCEYYENEFRKFQFQNLLAESSQKQQQILSISKDRFLNYLFDETAVMMLYSINPYLLGDELAQFQTKDNEFLDYLEFSKFLLVDREPTYFQYSKENVQEARKLGRGIKCAPIIGKWIDETGIYQLFIETYKSIDMHGDGKIDKTFLAKKLKNQSQKRRLTEVQVIEIVNINKTIPLNRLLYEIEHEQRQDGQDWTFEQFQAFLNNYKRRETPEKDKLITKLILTGKFDPSYVYILSQEIIQIIKEIFTKTPKFAEYFVVKQKFLQNICKDPRYKRIQGMSVRSQSNRYVHKQTLQQTLIRMNAEGEQYLDIEQILDFLTNRGRPKLIEYRVYIQNLERQIQLIEEQERIKLEKYGEGYQTTSSDEQFGEIIKRKRIQRKKNKLLNIRNQNAFDHSKRFNVTIPIPFGFEVRDKNKKISIREKKVQEMVDEKAREQAQAMQLFRAKEVPKHVKDNLYEKMLKDEARQRKERLERFRLQIMSQVHVSESLMRPKSTQIHCDFGQGKEFKFIARPMPWYCEVNLMDRINKKKAERKQKIFEEIFNRNKDFDLPEGVQKMIERQEEIKSKRDAKRTASTGSVGQCTFMPRITSEVPDFKTKHEHLHFYLQNAKNEKDPITMEPFSFENRPAKSRTTYQTKKKPDARHSKYEKGPENNEDYTNIPKTQKFEALVELRRKQNREKQQQVQKQKRSQAIRKLREQKFAPIVRKVLKQNAPDMSKSRGVIAGRIKEFKRQQKRKKMQYENEMIKIYTKVFQRPLLIESGGIQQKESRQKSPPKNIKESQLKKSKNAKGQLNNEDYLQNYYGDIQNPKGKGNHRNVNAANFREEHPPGLYPPEDYDNDQDEENQINQSDLYEQEYEEGGNVHTS